MNVIDKIKKLKRDLADDGSLELCDSWLKDIEDSKENRQLLKNEEFSAILDKMEVDFKEAMTKCVDMRPELKAIKTMFARVYGKKEVEKKINDLVDEFLKNN